MFIESGLVDTAMMILVTALVITNISLMYWLTKKKKK